MVKLLDTRVIEQLFHVIFDLALLQLVRLQKLFDFILKHSQRRCGLDILRLILAPVLFLGLDFFGFRPRVRRCVYPSEAGVG